MIRALGALGATSDETCLVGDSSSDVDAARHVGIGTIGYANKPGKRERLTSAGAQAVVDDLDTVTCALRNSHDRTTRFV